LEIEEYFAQIKAVVDQYAAATFVVSATVAFETRSGDQGFLAGKVQFVDSSELHFREYLDVAAERIEKVMYSYHYQDPNAELVFRYDNAAHRPTLAVSSHRHDLSGVKAIETPRLEQVLAEVAERQRWV
jgi:Family of unknown function (DUF6516)